MENTYDESDNTASDYVSKFDDKNQNSNNESPKIHKEKSSELENLRASSKFRSYIESELNNQDKDNKRKSKS